MTTITIPKDLQLRLQGLKDRAELRSEDGRLIGFFNPKPTVEELMASCPHTEEELRERARNAKDTGRTTEDVLRELRAKCPTE
jgi:hypothetical protein